MSNLLVGKLLTIRPALAVKIGLNEAILLQQLDYWLNHADKEHEGRMWIYKSYEKWQEQDFPFWSVSTVKRIVKRLRDINLIDVESLSDNFNNRVNYYTINHNELDKLSPPSCQSDTRALGQSDTAPSYQVDTTPSCQSDTFSKEINKEIKEESRHDNQVDEKVLEARQANASFIANWKAPDRQIMETKLFLAGTPMQMTDGQYKLYIDDFKAHFEDRANDGHNLKSDGRCQAKLRDWLQRERKSHNEKLNAGGDTANRPHNSRSDAFTTDNRPKLTREQQIEKNRLAMQQAGL